MELPDKATCHRALQSSDPRFDGLIYVGVKTTGIYCRPICPARTAKYENCTLMRTVLFIPPLPLRRKRVTDHVCVAVLRPHLNSPPGVELPTPFRELSR